MKRLLTIGRAAKLLSVSVQTLRRWDREGKLVPAHRTPGGQRRYEASQLRPSTYGVEGGERATIAYARVSSHDQKDDFLRQKQMLELYCASQGWAFEIIGDMGSGMNYRKRGLKKLLEGIIDGSVGRLVLTHKDRLLRFGAELVFSICEERDVEVILINQGDEPSFEEELAQDVLEIITVFSARLYGSRSRKNKKLIDDMKEAVKNAQA
jgi:excisionase family DNA binding protein